MIRIFQMMRLFFPFSLIILGLQCKVGAQKKSEFFTIYLVRHSEKNLSSSSYDSPLTACGEQRSEYLKGFLNDVDIEAIYSTDYERTEKTAEPTALSKELEITVYNESELEELSILLRERKQNALVVGHTYTTGVLAGILVGEEIGSFSLDIYDRIYKVVIHKEQSQLDLLHSEFECQD